MTEAPSNLWIDGVVGNYAAFLTAAAVALVFLVFCRNYRNRPRLPPGPPGWPVIGHLLLLDNKVPPHQMFQKLAEKYGPLMDFRLGSVRMVVVSSSEMAKEVLKTQDHIFASRPKTLYGDVMHYGSQDLLFSPLGDRFRMLRKISSTELFSPKRVQQFKEVRRNEVNTGVEDLLREGRDGKAVNLRHKLAAISFNNITRVMFSRKLYEPKLVQKEETSEMVPFPVVLAELVTIGFYGIAEFLHWLRRLDIDGFEGKLRKAAFNIDRFFENMLQEYRERYSSGTVREDEQMDFANVLLQLQRDRSITGETPCLSDDMIKGLLFDVIAGSTETSSNSSLWTMAELMRHPDVMARLKDELDLVVGKDRLVDESDLEKLPYLRAVLNESFRLHPPVGILPPHENIEATKIDGYDIPNKTRVLVNVYAIMRDPKSWPNPLEFNPSRFLMSSIDFRASSFEFLPFGSGRRMCPGMNMGRLFVEFSVAQLLQTCNFSLPEGMKPEVIKLDEAPSGATIGMLNDFEVMITPRLEKSVYEDAGISF